MRIKRLYDYLAVIENGEITGGELTIGFENVADGSAVKITRCADEREVFIGSVSDGKIRLKADILADGLYRINTDGAECLIIKRLFSVFWEHYSERVELSRIWNAMLKLSEDLKAVEKSAARALVGFVTE